MRKSTKLTFKQRRMRFIIHALYPLVRLRWRIFKPKKYGAKVIIEHGGKFLIIRNSYGSGRPTFPGGGIDEGETPEETAIREIEEEVGLIIQPKFLGEIVSATEGKQDHVSVFTAIAETDKLIVDEFEIKEATWLLPEEFPALSPVAKRLWEMYLANK